MDTASGFTLVESETWIEEAENPQTGERQLLEMHRAVYVADTQASEGSVASSCSVTYTHSTPARGGGVHTVFAYSQGNVTVSSACSGGVSATLRLRMESGHTFVIMNSHRRFVNRGTSAFFYVSKNCVNYSVRTWVAGYDGQTSSLASVPCTA